MHELLELLLVGAIIKARHDAYEKHGVFMPPEAFATVELCDRLLHEAGLHPDS